MGDPTNSLSFFRLSRGRAIRPIRLPPWLPLKAASQLTALAYPGLRTRVNGIYELRQR
jgi:hypothetical protein